jgi:hypothetical protein
MGDRWYAWWRGDQIEASFAKQVAYALRATAYQTMLLGKANVVRRQYADLWSAKTTKRGKYRGRWVANKQYRFGPSGKRWRRYIRSNPGEFPTNQTGFLRASIQYKFRDAGGGLLESFAGPTAEKGKKDSWKLTDGKATHALEWGGDSINHGGKVVQIAARPFMRPAGMEVLKSGLLRRTLENSLGRNSQKPPTLAIGWLGS